VFFVLIDIYERNRPGRYIIENESVLWKNKKKQQPWEWDFFFKRDAFQFLFFQRLFRFLFFVFVCFCFVCFCVFLVPNRSITHTRKKNRHNKSKKHWTESKRKWKKKLKLFFFAIYESQFLLTFFFYIFFDVETW